MSGYTRPAMVLERLQLTNFRGFERLDLSFEPDLTVLVGINGCGKTSIIDALIIGLGLRGYERRDIHANATRVVIDLSLSDQPVVSVTGEHIASTGTGARISTSTQGKPQLDRLILIYGAHREARDKTPGLTSSELWPPRRAEWKFSAHADYNDFFMWFRQMEDEENERIRYDAGEENSSLNAVRNAIYRLFPGYTKLRVRRGGAMGAPIPRLTLEKNGTLLLFDALSEGERTSVAMIADIARRLVIAYPDAEDPLAAPCLLVIDEFEQHLHPQWQRELPSRLREVFPGAQMLLTTHSPIVVSELLPRQIRALQDFALLEGAHREGQDVNEILETLFGTASRMSRTQALIDSVDDALDEGELNEAADKLDTLEQQLGTDDPEIVRLRTLQRMIGAQDHDAVSEG